MFSARSRLAFGVTSTVISVVLIGLNIGIMPDFRNVAMHDRVKLCEAIAANSSVVVRQRDLRRLDAVLQLVVERNADIMSAAVRREDGSLVVAVGDHEANWKPLEDSQSTETQIMVPIRAHNEVWGSLELSFTPLSRPGMLGYFTNPQTVLVTFIGAATFLLSSIYLGKTLQHLDPSKVVPGRVRSALDTLAEGLLVLDHNQRVMLANQAFAEIVGEAPEKLLGAGRPISRGSFRISWKITSTRGRRHFAKKRRWPASCYTCETAMGRVDHSWSTARPSRVMTEEFEGSWLASKM